MIEQETVDKIFEAANIVDVVSEFVSLKKRGTNYFGCCPFHNEKTPSFSVSRSKNLYKCFGCGKAGNAVNFIMEHEQISYYEALKYLANKFHIEIKETERTPEEQERHDDRESMMVLNEFAKNTFINNMTETDEGRAIGYKYFKERGFNEETIKTFELGYSLSDRKSFTDFALKSGYQLKYLTSNPDTNIGTGLTIQREDGYTFDRFSSRVMFPIHNLTGKVIGFGGRVLDARTKGVNVKYMNSPQSVIYDKSRSLYGIYQAKAAIVKNDKCFLVEGYTDVLSMHQSGITNVVASNGTALTIEQIRLIHRFTNNITVLYDGDAAGIHAALRGIDLILAEEMNVKVLLLPDGEDPDSFARNHSSSELEDFIGQNETDFLLFKTKLLLNDAGNDPVKKSNLIGDIVTSISVVPDSIKRELYAKECSELMGIDERVLHIEINKRLRKKREQWYDEEQRELKKSTPSQLIVNKTISASNRCREYESELLTILINHGNDVLFTIAKDDEPSVDVTVEQYIDKELTDSNIEFQTPICKRMLDLYTSICSKGQKPGLTTFTLSSDTEMSRFAVDLLVPKNEVSNKFWEKHNQYISAEDRDLKSVIDSAIYGYKACLVQQSLDSIREKIKTLEQTPDNEIEMAQMMNQTIVLTNYKKRLFEYLKRVIG
ncbi:MAG: DNA primase [Salinivirgaceae bacterium]|nr:DNA primase [Salinivirgaceae bacterium]